MIVSELIDLLKKMPQDVKVVVRGYENGLDDIDDVGQCLLEMNKDTNWWDGTYIISGAGNINAVQIIEFKKGHG
jgi:hypothetical protein